MPYWATLQCGGTRPNGQRCKRMLAQIDLAPGSRIRMRCRSCGAFTEYERGKILEPMVVTTQLSSYATAGR